MSHSKTRNTAHTTYTMLNQSDGASRIRPQSTSQSQNKPILSVSTVFRHFEKTMGDQISKWEDQVKLEQIRKRDVARQMMLLDHELRDTLTSYTQIFESIRLKIARIQACNSEISGETPIHNLQIQLVDNWEQFVFIQPSTPTAMSKKHDNTQDPTQKTKKALIDLSLITDSASDPEPAYVGIVTKSPLGDERQATKQTGNSISCVDIIESTQHNKRKLVSLQEESVAKRKASETREESVPSTEADPTVMISQGPVAVGGWWS